MIIEGKPELGLQPHQQVSIRIRHPEVKMDERRIHQSNGF